jgi:DNA-binding HxlR family transcriptional regulator
MSPTPSSLRAPTPAEEALCQEGNSLCPVLAAISVIGTEWRLAIVHHLLNGPQRFSELLHSNPRLNAKTLSATLKFLEGSGVVQRTVVSTRPFVVVYSLTEMGINLGPAAKELRSWGERWVVPRHHRALPPPTRTRVIEPELSTPVYTSSTTLPFSGSTAPVPGPISAGRTPVRNAPRKGVSRSPRGG